MKCRLTQEMPHAASGKMLPVGHVIDHKDAHRLVGMGVAVPEDEECRARSGYTPESQAALAAAYQRADAGIHPDDFEAYAAGWMVGYVKANTKPKPDALGHTSNIWVHGPKWDEYAALLSAREDELLAEQDDEEQDDEADDDDDGEEVAAE